MKTDYPELEGKEVEFYDGLNTRIGKVSGCNYHVGISIEANDRYLLCLNGTKSPNYINYSNPMQHYNYRKLFHYLVKQIQEGYINPIIFLNETELDHGGKPTVNDCPYAQ